MKKIRNNANSNKAYSIFSFLILIYYFTLQYITQSQKTFFNHSLIFSKAEHLLKIYIKRNHGNIKHMYKHTNYFKNYLTLLNIRYCA
jgi:hypothetical protein